MSGTSVLFTPQTRAAYLAAVFDAGMSVQLSKTPKGIHRIRLNKTSRNPFLPAVLAEITGFGSLFSTNSGFRWSVEGQKDVQSFFEEVEPYILVRSAEVELLLRLLAVSPLDSTEPLAEEWKRLQEHRNVV